MVFEPNFMTTHVGSVPHLEPRDLGERLAQRLDIPTWLQLPRRDFRESMYAQYSAHLPGIVVDEQKEKIYFDVTGDLTPALETFYEHYLADEVAYFDLRPTYSAGFQTLLDQLCHIPGEWVKGQVTGPISFGLTVTDQDLRASLYHDLLADAIVKNTAMIARWQIQHLRTVRPNVILFVDEPYMASFGSAFISLSREQVTEMLNEVFAAIHQEGALAGVHCCANTDWSVLLETSVDILNLDSNGYLETLALYPAELRAFLDRGGIIAWGAVPNDESVTQTMPQELAARLDAGLKLICQKAETSGVSITVQELQSRSLLTPSCGLGSANIAVAEQVFNMLVATGELLHR